jgi:hypothetical protein
LGAIEEWQGAQAEIAIATLQGALFEKNAPVVRSDVDALPSRESFHD